MSKSLETTARRFFAAWGESFEAACASFEQTFAPDCRWDQRPIPVLRGPKQAVRFMKVAHRTMGLETIDVEVLNLASTKNTVFSERIDHLTRADGSIITSARVTGVMDFGPDGKLVDWREYFDAATFSGGAVLSTLRHRVLRTPS